MTLYTAGTSDEDLPGSIHEHSVTWVLQKDAFWEMYKAVFLKIIKVTFAGAIFTLTVQ